MASSGKPGGKAAPKWAPTAKAASKLLAKPGGKPAATPGAKPAAGPEATPEVLSKQELIFLMVCLAVAIASILTVIIVAIMHATLHEFGSLVDYPMKKVKDNLAYTLDDPALETSGAMDVADAVDNLPNNIDDAEREYDDKKKIYQSLFHKAMRSSSFGPWKLHGKSLYYFAKGEKTWYDAENFCLSRDAHLASIFNDEEQNFITSQITEASWIGLMDESKQGKWRWSDGSGVQREYWSPGEPSHRQHAEESDHDCVLIVPSSTNRNWNNDNCHKRYRWICKQELDSV